jgi:hypothetical protein
MRKGKKKRDPQISQIPQIRQRHIGESGKPQR